MKSFTKLYDKSEMGKRDPGIRGRKWEWLAEEKSSEGKSGGDWGEKKKVVLLQGKKWHLLKRKRKPIFRPYQNQFPDSGGISRFRRRRFEISKFDKVEITGRVNFFDIVFRNGSE